MVILSYLEISGFISTISWVSVLVTAGEQYLSPRGHILPSSIVDLDWFEAFESIKIHFNCDLLGQCIN